MATTARDIALEVINRANKSGSYANLLLPRVLEKSYLQVRDKALATQLTYGTLRNQGTLDWLIKQYANDEKRTKGKVLDILRLGAYQIYYLDTIPDRAAVNESVELTKKHYSKRVADFVNVVLRKISSNKKKVDFKPLKKEFAEYLSIKYSHPRWLTEMLLKQFGKRKTEAICKANNKTPELNLRVNTVRISVDAFEKQLKKKGYNFKRSKLVKDSIILEHHGPIKKIFGYQEGLFSVQDQSSSLVSHVVDPLPGDSVIEAAAAPGGKTVHMAALMKNKGTIIAADVSAPRLTLLDPLRKRLNVKIVIPLAVDARNLTKYVKRTVDKVLVDAPCSGLGTLARRPDERWRKSEETIHKMSQLQLEMMDSVASLVRKEGILVYSVCTLIKEETDGLCEDFLSYHPEFEIVDISNVLPEGEKPGSKYGIQILPFKFQSDGMFIAKFKKVRQPIIISPKEAH